MDYILLHAVMIWNFVISSINPMVKNLEKLLFINKSLKLKTIIDRTKFD